MSHAVSYIYLSRNQAKHQISRLFVILGQYYSEDRVFACVLRLIFAWVVPQSCVRHEWLLYLHFVQYRHRIRFVVYLDVLIHPEYGRSDVRGGRDHGRPPNPNPNPNSNPNNPNPNPDPNAMGWPVIGCCGLWRVWVNLAGSRCYGLESLTL